jgi:hypothetical protein
MEARRDDGKDRVPRKGNAQVVFSNPETDLQGVSCSKEKVRQSENGQYRETGVSKIQK